MITKAQREQCRLYKAIAEVFYGRIGLSDQQKHDLISDCYRAARLAMEQQQQERQKEQMNSISLGRRYV